MKNKLKPIFKGRKIKVGYIFALIIIIAFVVLILKLILPGSGNNKYGDRCEGTKENPFTEKAQAKVSKNLTDREVISKASIKVDCKLIKILYIVKKDVSKEDAKNIAGEAYNLIPEKVRAMYDVQFEVGKENEEGTKSTNAEGKEITTYQFPIIGYSNKKNPGIVWSNN
jgi:hypothetical protein